MRVRKKPVEVQAWQWYAWPDPRNLTYRGPSVCGMRVCGMVDSGLGKTHVHTTEGPLGVSNGDWIIQGVNGEVNPCKPDVFEKTYEIIEKEPA
jgi:hypothetical protein